MKGRGDYGIEKWKEHSYNCNQTGTTTPAQEIYSNSNAGLTVRPTTTTGIGGYGDLGAHPHELPVQLNRTDADLGSSDGRHNSPSYLLVPLPLPTVNHGSK
jgi:hypothetical protein